MAETRTISDLVKTLAGSRDAADQVFPARVKSVDASNGVVEVEDSTGLRIEDVSLTARPGSTADLLIVPAEDSAVLVGMVANQSGQLYVAMFSEVAEVIFHGGELGGMVKAPELEAQAQKVSNFMQALLQVVNGAPIPEPGNGSPSAFQTALKAVLASAQVPDWNDLQNGKVKH